ncbi:hypothetical protein [Streptomyces sp. NPDC057877]|uniref:hypothetical protein n=1 Tax=Streptomyces sp. NPDC057877 TaxID=3346269 RepID=UPI0036CD51EA
MPTRSTLRGALRTMTAAAVLTLALGGPAEGRPLPARTPAAEPPATLCAPAGTLRGAGGQRATVSLCAGSGTPSLSVTAPAACHRPGTTSRLGCVTSGSWTARQHGETVASGTLPGSATYPGPGTYDLEAEVRVRSTPDGVDLSGTVRATLTLTAPKARPTHRMEVTGGPLRPGTTTALTYTLYRDSEEGDGSARFGLIGEEASGVRLATDDARCVNPLIGRHPSDARLAYSLDCALTDLQPGRPATVTVRVTLGARCSTVVSKLGYWIPRGQALYTGGMLAGPTVGCPA